MSFKSLDRILGDLQHQAPWQEQQQFRRLSERWPQIVGSAVAERTRLLSIHQQVLRVATSSAVWAQQLTFERRRILPKLNSLLATPLVDIHFSTAGWSNRPTNSLSSEPQSGCWHQHPSWVPDTPPAPAPPQIPTPQQPHAAFQRWAKTIQARTQSLPLCPQCQCPTPPGELQRWFVCALCANKGLGVSDRLP